MDLREYGLPMIPTLVPYPPWHNYARDPYAQNPVNTVLNNPTTWNTCNPNHPGVMAAWIPSRPITFPGRRGTVPPKSRSSGGGSNNSTNLTCTTCGDPINNTSDKNGDKSKRTPTTNKSTIPLSRKKIYIQNPGIDLALRNFCLETTASLKTYQALAKDFRAQTSLLQDSVDDSILDKIWKSKIRAKIRDSKNPERKRDLLHGLPARLENFCRAIQDAINKAKAALLVLGRVISAGGQQIEEEEAYDSNDSDFFDVDIIELYYFDDYEQQHCNDGDMFDSSSAPDRITKEIRYKIEQQIRAAKKALVYCDAMVDLAERATAERAAGEQLVDELREVKEVFSFAVGESGGGSEQQRDGGSNRRKKYHGHCMCKFFSA
ncbi:hypothetical protein B0H66DRAFT_526835 [Apodospora peruviana]|uniref:Uncharacterized protein n=1 Tax=Apodospora peruviana TaxID=516989 RepID=A0AAE0MEG5_9PEZI|nr:hypothetical protein B0H66DRAFT_526835 [Apodospora peruviana]